MLRETEINETRKMPADNRRFGKRGCSAAENEVRK
jgi:hypothetical protein